MLKNLREAIKPKILLPNAKHLPKATSGVLPWMWFFIRPYSSVVYVCIFIRIMRSIFYSLITYYFSVLIDRLQSGDALANQAAFWHDFSWIAFLYLVVMSSFMVLMFESLVFDKMGRGMTLFSVKHMLALPLDWHEQKGSGAKMQRVMQARENLRLLYNVFSRDMLKFIGDIIGVMIIFAAMDVPLFMALLFIGYVLTYIVLFQTGSKTVDRHQNHHSALKENLVSRVYDFVSLIRIAKAFVLDNYIMSRSYSSEKEGHDVLRKIRLITFGRWTALNLVVWFWVGLIIVVGIHQVFDARITVGAFSALIFIAYRMWGTLEDLVISQNDYFENKSGFLRIRETLSMPAQDHDVEPVVSSPRDWLSIECRNLAFGYHADQPVLKNITLTIPRGKHVAFIGHSGAGKSTMVKLLMKQIVPIGGDIIIGDTSLKHIDSNDWLNHLALVPQDVELMNGTLRDNVLLDRDDVDEAFYQECLRKSYLEEFIKALPDGDQTEIGERGIKLSGGQRQRLGIARALVRNAQIIILDEATSSLDSESEAYIQRAMQHAFADKTVIVIAHRLSTIRHADLIYVLDHGNISEHGNFSSLEKSNGIFAKLWAMQSNGFITG